MAYDDEAMTEIAKTQAEFDARCRELASINVGLLGDSTGFVDSQLTWQRCKVEQQISELETRLKMLQKKKTGR